MAGRRWQPLPSRSKCLLLLLLLLSAAVLFFLFSAASSRTSAFGNHSSSVAYPSEKSETSFLVSLEHFLARHRSSSRDDTARGVTDDAAVVRFDQSVLKHEGLKLQKELHYPMVLPIRVYVYEMPRKFTYDLLKLFLNTYGDTTNLTSNGSPVHRLIEQHSIDYWLWADLLAPDLERPIRNTVVRVYEQEDADLFYIPFFTTISFFLLEKQQCKALYRDADTAEDLTYFLDAGLTWSVPVSFMTRRPSLVNAVEFEALKWVTDQPAWKRSEGRDHILPVHHPWSFKSVRRYMKKSIWLLPDMDSTGNWYKPGQVYLEKDLILPYVPNVDLCDAKCMRESQSKRTTLLFFRGRLKRNAGGKIRAMLVTELSGAMGVVIEEGTAGDSGKAAAQNGMRKSIFCLNPAGDTPSSARLFDAIVSGCIPIIVSDELELPFEGILDYRKIALFVSSIDAFQPGWLLSYLGNVSSAQIRIMQDNLVKCSRHFIYSSPAQPLGPEDLTWRMMAGKLMNIKLHTRRSQRFVKDSRSICNCDCRHANSTGSLPGDSR